MLRLRSQSQSYLCSSLFCALISGTCRLPPFTAQEKIPVFSEEVIDEPTTGHQAEEVSVIADIDDTHPPSAEDASATPDMNDMNTPHAEEVAGPSLLAKSHPQQSESTISHEEVVVPSATRVLEVDPYPYSLSTPGGQPEPTEQGELSAVSQTSWEENTQGDSTSATTSQDQDALDVDEMELSYPAESDIKAEDDAPESVVPVEVEDDETDADGDDDPDYVDSNSSVGGGVNDVEQLTDEASSTVREELALDEAPSTPEDKGPVQIEDGPEELAPGDVLMVPSVLEVRENNDPVQEEHSPREPASGDVSIAPSVLEVQDEMSEGDGPISPSQETEEVIVDPAESTNPSAEDVELPTGEVVEDVNGRPVGATEHTRSISI